MFLLAGVLAAISYLAQPSAGKNEIAASPAASKRTEPPNAPEANASPKADSALRGSISQELRIVEAYVNSPELRQEISGLRPGATAEIICQFSKDWFISQDKNIDVLWEYIKARKSAWPAALRDEVFALVHEAVEKRQGRTYQPRKKKSSKS